MSFFLVYFFVIIFNVEYFLANIFKLVLKFILLEDYFQNDFILVLESYLVIH